MKKFKFRFQVVLNKIARELDQITLLMVKEQKKLKQAERILKGYRLMLKEHVNKFKESRKKVLFVEELVLYQRYLAKLYSGIHKQEVEIRELKKTINEIRVSLIEKNKEKKILEKLKESDYQDYIQTIERAEQKLLDELATLNFNRQAR